MNDWIDKRMTEKRNYIRISPVSGEFVQFFSREVINKRKCTYSDRKWIRSTNLLFQKGKWESTSVTVYLTIDDTSDVKISFYFRQQNRHSSIIEKKIDRKKNNFSRPNWFPFREHDSALFRLKAEGTLFFL